MAFGENLTAKIYRNQTPRQLTRWGVFQEIHTALIAVGMKFIPALSGFMQNALIEDIDETVDQITNGAENEPWWLAVYDYPVADTFTINGEEWKPAIVMLNQNAFTGSSPSSGQYFRLQAIVRKVNADDWVAVRNETNTVLGVNNTNDQKYGYLNNLIFNYGLADGLTSMAGNGSETDNVNSYMSAQIDRGGLLYPVGQVENIRHSLWDNYLNNESHDQIVTVRNLEVVLSPAGLLIQMGSGTRKLDNNDLLSYLCAFMDRRIPGRGAPIANDPDIESICPVIGYSLGNDYLQDGIYHDDITTYRALRGMCLGGKFTDPITGTSIENMAAIRCWTWNFDNIDRAIQSESSSTELAEQMATQRSPRTIAGSGYHILSPTVVGLAFDENNTSDKYGSQAPAISTDEVWWRWSELLYSDKWVMTDAVAPAGIFQDPASGREYFMFRSRGHNMMMGLDVDDHDPIITPAGLGAVLPTHTLLDETQYTMASGSLQLASGPVAVTQTSVGASWNFTPATDELTRTGWTTQNENAITFELDVSGDADGIAYELVFEVYNRGTAATGPSDSANWGRQNNQVRAVQRINNNGTYDPAFAGNYRNTGEPASPYEEVRAFVTRNMVDQVLKLGIAIDYIFGTAAKSVGIRNIRLRRYTMGY